MNKRRERTLKDLCEATATVSNPEITPVLRGNNKTRGPGAEANSDLLTHMVTSQVNNSSSSSDRRHKSGCRGKAGVCNVCSAPCSSCFHASEVLTNATDESGGETCAENVVVDQGKQLVIEKLGEVSTVADMNSKSYSFSENTVGKASSRTSDVSASDDNVVHSEVEGCRVPEGHDDCLSCISGTDENANKNLVTGDGRRQSKNSGESSHKLLASSLPIELSSQDSVLLENLPSKSTDKATDVLKVPNTLPQDCYGKSLFHEPNYRNVNDDRLPDPKSRVMEVSSEPSSSAPIKKVELDVPSADPIVTDLNSIEKNDDVEAEIQSTDETDDSDMVEHDVKVCDICGDAGREDSLAVCCQCSDGAEHTYCMREMLDKVPEGDWLCEECRSVELVRYERKEKMERVDEDEKNNSTGQASSENIVSSEVEGHKPKGHMKISNKRLRDDADMEVSSKVKKPALESPVGLPKSSSSGKTTALTRDLSFKNLDKSRVQSPSHSSSDTVPVHCTTEPAQSASDLQRKTFRGTFSKSSSFNSVYSKPKVKLVDQVALQRQKSARERSSVRLKDSVARSIGRSMSFKSAKVGRPDLRKETLSPRSSRIQDSKMKNRGSFERQSSFKAEHSVNPVMGASVSSTSKMDGRLGSRENGTKSIRADGKAPPLSRSSSLAARRNADLSNSTGEFKRPSLHSHSAVGVLSANGVNNTEQRHSHINPKEEITSSSATAAVNEIEGSLDGLSRPRNSKTVGERMREVSGSQFRASCVKSSRDESNDIKAAIEAAVLKKPSVYRKRTAVSQSDESRAPVIGSNVATNQDQISNTAQKKFSSSPAELNERQPIYHNSTADSLKQGTLDSVKQFPVVPAVDLSSVGGGIELDIKSSLRDMFSNIPATMPSFLKSLAIPEHEYIWQGSFEISRTGEIDLWGGLQAHLSTRASPKVVEAVHKFKSRIVLYEVPRLSTWPVQFQEHGVREDNIALFFFAKDLASYDKIYKVSLDNMMKNDLALKGNVDGVELLIFPSNQLPCNSQRWNMLFFLWAVFRGKKESCLQTMPVSIEQSSAPRDIPPAIMSLSESRCSLTPIMRDMPSSIETDHAPKMPGPAKPGSLLSSRDVNGDSGAKVPSLNWPLDNKLNFSSSDTVRGDLGKQCEEPSGTSEEGDINSSCRPVLSKSSSYTGRENMLPKLDASLIRQQSANDSVNCAAVTRGMAPAEGLGERRILNRETYDQDDVHFRKNAEYLSVKENIRLKKDQHTIDLNVECDRSLLGDEEPLHPTVETGTFYSGTTQLLPRDDGTCAEPRLTFEEMNHVATSSVVLENQFCEASDEMNILERKEAAERHLFPVQSQPPKGICLGDRSMPWRTHPVEQDRLSDRAPSLELALGAEINSLTQATQPLLVGNLDKGINEHIIDERGSKAEEDVSASLSLSLSFPFPDN